MGARKSIQWSGRDDDRVNEGKRRCAQARSWKDTEVRENCLHTSPSLACILPGLAQGGSGCPKSSHVSLEEGDEEGFSPGFLKESMHESHKLEPP